MIETPTRAPRGTARRRTAVAVLVVAALAGACSSSAGSDGAAKPSTTTTAATETAVTETAVTETAATETTAEVEAFTGTLDEFYEVPDPLPAGKPGALIRTMPMKGEDGEVVQRIMYHSTDVNEHDRAVTGVVAYPTADAPDDGWPIVAWAHGTSGMSSSCAPSRGDGAPPAYGIEGVRVASDYIGLGPKGELHSYLSSAAEGHAVIDGVAAARSIPEAHAGDRWVVAGVSQGGHAVLVTNEQAAKRLPDAELVGAAALAPGAQLSETYGDPLQIRIIKTMVLFGAAEDDPEIDPHDFLPPATYDVAAKAIQEGCISDISSTLAGLAGDEGYFTKDPSTDPVGARWLAANDPGSSATATPLLLVQGGKDMLVLPARTDALFARLCDLGQEVQRLDVPEADHDTVATQSTSQVSAWLADRFADRPATNDC